MQGVAVVQPSSAAAERAFSLLNASFGDQHQHVLQDYVVSSLMLQFNIISVNCVSGLSLCVTCMSL